MKNELRTVASVKAWYSDPGMTELSGLEAKLVENEVVEPGDELVRRRDLPSKWMCQICDDIFYNSDVPVACPNCGGQKKNEEYEPVFWEVIKE